MKYKRVAPMFAVYASMDGQKVNLIFEAYNKDHAMDLAQIYIQLQCKFAEIYDVREI